MTRGDSHIKKISYNCQTNKNDAGLFRFGVGRDGCVLAVYVIKEGLDYERAMSAQT